MVLGLLPLLLSPWTAPRGDNDGLWILIVPLLAVFMFVLPDDMALSAAVEPVDRTRT